MQTIKLASARMSFVSLICNCTKTFKLIQAKSGNIQIAANGKLKVWKDFQHPGFNLILSVPMINNLTNHMLITINVKAKQHNLSCRQIAE